MRPVPATRRSWLIWVGPLALTVAFAIAPLATGARTLFLRDVLNGHLGLRAHLAEALRRGELPLIDPLRAGGQVLMGNPNAVPLYPDNLLLLFGSTLWQLNSHFWIHGLLAFFAMFALARIHGLGREAALVAATVYGASGFMLSQMNLFNGVAGAALAPGLAAALLASTEPRWHGRAAAAFGALWALELLAGDPLVAVLALVLAASLALVERRRVPWPRIAAAWLAGTAVAAPQWVELLRQLPTSFRALYQAGPELHGVGSPDPRALIDWFVPFFFGRPDLQQSWGKAHYFGGMEPLHYSLAPGLLALALLAVAFRQRQGRERVAWWLFLSGLILAYSRGAAESLLANLPGGELFRYPMKFALWTAVAGSLLAGVGFERLTSEPRARRRFVAALTLLALGFVVAWSLFSSSGGPLVAAFRGVFAVGLDDAAYNEFRRGWAFTGLVQLAVALALLGVESGRRRGPNAALGALLALHAGSQLILSAPMLATDEAERYRAPLAWTDRIASETVLVHGAVFHLFGSDLYRRSVEPDRRFVQTVRRAQRELTPFAGALDGRRYEFACSPEGLDSYLVDALAVGMWRLNDAQRLRVLRATGVDLLLLPRPLLAGTDNQIVSFERLELPDPLWLYSLRGALGEVQLLGDRRYAPEISSALAMVANGELDPALSAVLAGSGEARVDPPGRARIVFEGPERFDVEADSPNGGALVVRRAWLPHWRAEIDGRRVATVVANVTRLAVELPPGRHTVRFWIERTPFRLALGASAFGCAALVALFLAGENRARAVPS